MLLFSTVLSINDTMSKDDFIRLAIEWNQGSPHKENVIPGLVWNGGKKHSIWRRFFVACHRRIPESEYHCHTL